jgi:hypothetical protein
MAVALDVHGMRVGYAPRWLFPAIVEANKAGFYVLMQAKRHTALSARELEVRSSNGADLRAWMLVPHDVRGTTFFELDWRKLRTPVRLPGPVIGGHGRCR